jgi:hypothetical protein
LVPATASLDATGHFSVPINPGICFAGSVEISVWSKAYAADAVAEDCVGELVESEAIELSSLVLTFAAAPPGG